MFFDHRELPSSVVGGEGYISCLMVYFFQTLTLADGIFLNLTSYLMDNSLAV